MYRTMYRDVLISCIDTLRNQFHCLTSPSWKVFFSKLALPQKELDGSRGFLCSLGLLWSTAGSKHTCYYVHVHSHKRKMCCGVLLHLMSPWFPVEAKVMMLCVCWLSVSNCLPLWGSCSVPGPSKADQTSVKTDSKWWKFTQMQMITFNWTLSYCLVRGSHLVACAVCVDLWRVIELFIKDTHQIVKSLQHLTSLFDNVWAVVRLTAANIDITTIISS